MWAGLNTQICCLSKLPDLINLKVATIMFKARQNILPPNLQELFQIGNINIYNTRQSDCFKQKS